MFLKWLVALVIINSIFRVFFLLNILSKLLDPYKIPNLRTDYPPQNYPPPGYQQEQQQSFYPPTYQQQPVNNPYGQPNTTVVIQPQPVFVSNNRVLGAYPQSLQW